MKNKENALKDYIEMIEQSWTWGRLTEDEQNRFFETINEPRTSDAIKGNYMQRWEIIDMVYYAYIMALGYKPIGWREPEEESATF